MDLGPRALADGGIVGRTGQLATLATLLDAARAGRGRAALVVGEAGIGKTTLVRELADRAGSAAIATIWCWCPPDNAVPYFPWGRLLRHLNLPDPAGAAGIVGHVESHDLDRQRMFASHSGWFGVGRSRTSRADRPGGRALGGPTLANVAQDSWPVQWGPSRYPSRSRHATSRWTRRSPSGTRCASCPWMCWRLPSSR